MPDAPFVGRERELELYQDFLAKDTPWVLNITGMPGCGKSTLLTHLITMTKDTYNLPVIALNFNNEELRVDPLQIVAQMAGQVADQSDPDAVAEFNHNLQEARDKSATLETRLHELLDRNNAGTAHSQETRPALSEEDLAIAREIRLQVRAQVLEAFYEQMETFRTSQLVLILDTCEWLENQQFMEIGQWVLKELLPGLHFRMQQNQRRCSAVLASRAPLKLKIIQREDQQQHDLSRLKKTMVDEYLEFFDMRDPELRQRIYDITRGHPLFVSIIGALWQERERKPFTLADLPELEEDFNEQAQMKFIQERLNSQLSSPFLELTQYGVLLRTFDLPLLRAVFPELLPEFKAHIYFNQLIHYPFIESLENYRYAFHELLRAIQAEHTREKEPDKWQLYHRRALDYFTRTAPYSPDWYYHALACDEEQAISDWLQDGQVAQIQGEQEHLLALLRVAGDVALKLTPLAQARRAQLQGNFSYQNTRLEEALQSYRDAISLYQQMGDRLGEANVRRAIGDVQQLQKKSEDALRSYQQALDLYQQLEDRLGAANTFKSIGDIQLFRMEIHDALENYKDALDLYQVVEDRLGEANVLRAVGDILFPDNMDAALDSYEQALARYREIHNQLGEANVLKAIGDVQAFLKDIESASKNYQQALSLFRQLNNRTGEANILKDIGDVQLFHEQIEAAQKSYEDALALFREIADRLGQANVLCALGDIMRFRERPGEALQFYQEAHLLHQQVGNAFGEATALKAIGDMQCLYDRPDVALQYYRDAHRLFQHIGDQFGEANCDFSMGQVAFTQEHYDKALDLYTKAALIYQNRFDEFSLARLRYYRSFAYEEMHKQADAIQDMKEAVSVAERLNLPFVDLFRQRLDRLQEL